MGLSGAVVADLHSFIVSHKLQGAALIGHSMGGTIGLLLAKAQRTDIGRLMIVDMIPRLAEIVMPGMSPEQVNAVAGGMRTRFIDGAKSPTYADQAKATAAMYGVKPESQTQIVA